MGISVIPGMGKNNLDRPTAIFRKLQIPVYVIWDSDYGNKETKSEDNHRLLRLFDQSIEDWPAKATKQFACFKHTLNEPLRTEIGEEFFDNTLDASCDRLCLGKKRYAVTNPQIIQEIIEEAKKNGKSTRTLENVISLIIALKI